MIDVQVLEKLEYYKIMERISHYAFCSATKERIMNSVPYSSYIEAKDSLELTQSAYYIMSKLVIYPSFRIEDILPYIEDAKRNLTLMIGELYNILEYAKLVNRLLQQLSPIDDIEAKPIIDIVNNIESEERTEAMLNKALKNQYELNDDATPTLLNIRNNIIKTKNKINARLKKYIVESDYNKFLQDNIISVRDNRFVIPLKVEYKDKIKGIIHDQSNSGQTLFVEPLDVLEMNNELRSLQIEEDQEIENILRTLSKYIKDRANIIDLTVDSILNLDMIFSKANYAIKNNAVCPEYNNRGIIELIQARHPLLDRTKSVHNTVKLNDKRILIISGPNAGGKTVTMKMVGLLTLLGMSGVFPTSYEKSNLSFFENVFCDIGDRQSIENSLSTFSSHLTNLSSIINNISKNSLVLLDELGGGTDPQEGSALAIAITQYIEKSGAKGVITTHYNNIKAYSDTSDNLLNASMDYDEINMTPTYRLLVGSAGSSIAIQIAGTYGIKKEILDVAKTYLQQDSVNYEQAIAESERKSRQLAKLLDENKQIVIKNDLLAKELERKNAIMDERLDSINKRANSIIKDKVRDYQDKADEIISEMKELLRENDEANIIKMSKVRKNLAQKIEQEETDKSSTLEFLDGKIVVGDTVYNKNINQIGEVLSIKGNKAQLSVGNLIIQAEIANLNRVKRISSTKKEERKRIISNPVADLNISSQSNELMLIGKQVYDAIQLLEDFIDKSVRTGFKTLRIVHGKGTFALRNAVRSYLKDCIAVESYRNGEYGEGDLGVTIVTLK